MARGPMIDGYMTDDELFDEFVEKVQKAVLAGCDVRIELGAAPYTIKGGRKVMRFNAEKARRDDGVGVQVYEAVAHLCIESD